MEINLKDPPQAPKIDGKKKGLMDKLSEAVPDREEQMQIIGVAVRLGIVVWSGFCLTLAYIDLPGFPKQTFDPTFIASVFTGALSSFGLTTSKNKGSGEGVSKKDMEAMIAKANTGGYQTIRVETPLKIEGATLVPNSKPKPTDT